MAFQVGTKSVQELETPQAGRLGTFGLFKAGVAKRLRQRLVVPPSGGSNPLARP